MDIKGKGKASQQIGKEKERRKWKRKRRGERMGDKNFINTTKYKVQYHQDREFLKQLIFPVRRSC